MTIRAWQEQDIDILSQIEERCFIAPWSKSAFQEVLKYPLHHTFLIEDRGQVCGYACLLVLFEDAEIENIAVDLDYRGRGISKLLMQAMHDKAKELGAKRCLLEVRVSNQVARSLYEKYGYESYGVRKRYYENGEDAIVMQKQL